MYSHRASGVIAAWVIMILMILVGFLGLVCDLANVYLVGQQLQVAADAAALGGAQYVHQGDFNLCHSQALMVAQNNRASGDSVALFDADVEVGHFDHSSGQFLPYPAEPNGIDAVRVVARRPDAAGHTSPMFWGPLFGANTSQGGRTAVAMSLEHPGIAVLVLDPRAPGSLDLNGKGHTIKISIDNGGLQVDSNSPDAIRSVGNPVLDIPDLSTCAPYPPGSKPAGSGLNGNFWPHAPYVPDPLAWLQAYMDNYLLANPVGQMPQPQPVNGVYQPGYYPNGISGGNVTLSPGAYFVDNGLQITGNGSIGGNGVYIYIMSGTVSMNGTTSLSLSAIPLGPGAPPWAGVVIHQAASDTTPANIRGNESMMLGGTLYFPKAQLELGGNCRFDGSQIVVNMLHIYGDASLDIHYDGRFNSPGTVFLVQ
jgi:hypothetical protein